MSNSLTRWFTRMPRPMQVRRCVRPGIELLEDRTVPAVFEVNTLADTIDADPAITSLREAITAANSAAGDDSITFAPGLAGTIPLASDLPDLNSNLAIWGPGADLLEVRRASAGSFRIFTVTAGMVVLSGLRISNGSPPSGSGGGGGIHNGGTLTLTGSIVSGNSANLIGGGGGIANVGTLTLIDSLISGNSAHHGGGGIDNSGTLTVIGSTISDNAVTVAGDGGGIVNLGIATLTSSTVSHNSADSGAGIYNNGTLTLNGSTVSGNSANGNGGGIVNHGTLTANNATISNNSAQDAGGGIHNNGTLTVTGSTISGNSASEGGGISNWPDATLTASNSTISGNSALTSGGGIISWGTATLIHATVSANFALTGGGVYFASQGTATVHNTLVAGNFRSSGTVRDDVNGAVAAASSFNLIGDGTGLTGISDGVNGNQIGSASAPIDPRLGPLANNGGPTLTHALLTGSPALDRGLAPGAPVSDQRGVGRFGAPDIGAFELPPPLGAAQVVNVTGMVSLTKTKPRLMATGRIRQKVTLVNKSGQRIQGPISLVLGKLTARARLWHPSGRTKVWAPLKSFYLNRLPADGILDPGEKLTFVLEFVVPPGMTTVAYKARVLAGKGVR